MAALDTAQENRQLVVDELAAAAGQNWRTFDQACPVLLVAPGGESSDAAAVRGHGAPDRGVIATGGLESSGWHEETRRRLKVGDGEVSAQSLGKRVFWAFPYVEEAGMAVSGGWLHA